MDKHGSQLGERGFLARRNLISMGATRCPFYSRFTESTLHLLLHCHCSWYFSV
uniref:Reverse transcriptase zinc-binding domain-containing protein n=1 Tax=Populus trichocarpa TaxID=3694 RepID=A0A3N7FA59_POPTR